MRFRSLACPSVVWLLIGACLVLSSWAFPGAARAEDALVVVADDATFSQWEGAAFLKKNQVPVRHVRPDELEKFKKQPYLFVIGGANEPSMAPILRQLLAADELKWIEEQGNRKMYIKPDAWTKGQTVIVLAGSENSTALVAAKENQSSWRTQVESWFELEADPKVTRGY
jgi:hypothetical protein